MSLCCTVKRHVWPQQEGMPSDEQGLTEQTRSVAPEAGSRPWRAYLWQACWRRILRRDIGIPKPCVQGPSQQEEGAP